MVCTSRWGGGGFGVHKQVGRGGLWCAQAGGEGDLMCTECFEAKPQTLYVCVNMTVTLYLCVNVTHLSTSDELLSHYHVLLSHYHTLLLQGVAWCCVAFNPLKTP